MDEFNKVGIIGGKLFNEARDKMHETLLAGGDDALEQALNALLNPRPDTEKQDDSFVNLKMLGVAIHLYARRNNELLPARLEDATEHVKAVWDDDRLFVCPATGKPYIYMEGFSGKSLGEIQIPERTLLFYSEPLENGNRFVIFVAGNAAMVESARFAELYEETASRLWK